MHACHYSLYLYTVFECLSISLFKLALNVDGAKRQNGLLLIIAIVKITTLSKGWTTCAASIKKDAVNVLFYPSGCQSPKGVSEPLKAGQKKKKEKNRKQNLQFVVTKEGLTFKLN